MARAMVSVPCPKASNSKTPTGPFQTIVPADASTAASVAAVSGPMSRMSSSAPTSATRFTVAAALAANSRAVTTSVGIGTAAPRARIAAITARASPTSAGSARLLPIGSPSASRKVLAMPPPTIRRSTFVARLCRIASLVETLLPATMATSGRAGRASARVMRVDLGGEQRPGAGDLREFGDAVGRRLGAMRGAEGVVDEHVAQRCHLPRQRRVVLLLALVEAAVLEHDQLAGADGHAVEPVLLQRHARGRAARRCAQPPEPACLRAWGRLRSAGRDARSPSPQRRRRAPARCTAARRGCACLR